MKWVQPKNPWEPAEYDDDIVYAFRALAAGQANEPQQRLVLSYVQFVCGVGAFEDLPFRPGGVEGSRASDFAAGMKHAGLQLMKFLKPQLTPETKRDGTKR